MIGHIDRYRVSSRLTVKLNVLNSIAGKRKHMSLLALVAKI